MDKTIDLRNVSGRNDNNNMTSQMNLIRGVDESGEDQMLSLS